MSDLNILLKNILIILLIFYIVYAIPNLNSNIISEFNSIPTRIMFILAILLTGFKDPLISLLLSVCFVLMHGRLQTLLKLNEIDNTNSKGKDYSFPTKIFRDILDTVSENDNESKTHDSVPETAHDSDPLENNLDNSLDTDVNYKPEFKDLEYLLNPSNIGQPITPFDKDDHFKLIDDINSEKSEKHVKQLNKIDQINTQLVIREHENNNSENNDHKNLIHNLLETEDKVSQKKQINYLIN